MSFYGESEYNILLLISIKNKNKFHFETEFVSTLLSKDNLL